MDRDYKLGAQRMQETIKLNQYIIDESIRILSKNKTGPAEVKTLNAEIKSRNKHIEDINNHYNKLLKVYEWDPEILELLHEGWNMNLKNKKV